MIPGSDPAALVATFKTIVADPTVELSIGNRAYSARPYRPSTRISIARSSSERTCAFPGAEVTPYLFQAGTDAAAWRSRGVPVYGIYPYPIDADELTRMHGNDEKVSIKSLAAGHGDDLPHAGRRRRQEVAVRSLSRA